MIDVVIIEFTGMSDLWFHRVDWENGGRYRGFLKNWCISIRDIQKVTHKSVLESEFPTTEWEC